MGRRTKLLEERLYEGQKDLNFYFGAYVAVRELILSVVRILVAGIVVTIVITIIVLS